MALPRELVTLVEYVELNRSDWWTRALERLILAAVWRSDDTPTAEKVVRDLEQLCGVQIDPGRVRSRIDAMCSSGMLVRLTNRALKLSEQTARHFEEHIRTAESVEAATKRRFLEILTEGCPQLADEKTWELFDSKFLVPLVRDIGAQTYQLLFGKALTSDQVHIDSFLRSFNQECHAELRSALNKFLNPKDPNVRAHILRLLNAYFVVEASSVPNETLDALARATEGTPTFTLFLDTNFLFSLLGLQENPSNEAVGSLMALVKQVASRVTVKFYALTQTLDEAKKALTAKERAFAGITLTPNLVEAIPPDEIGGVFHKFLEEVRKAGYALTPQVYFDPYINNLIPIIRAKGVEHYNDPLDGFSTDQQVVDDILSKKEAQEKLGGRQKGYEQLQHDMILWHFVNRKRPARVESPVDAKYWVVTIDYGLIGFDAYKRRRTKSVIPVCIHPTTLVQMLQFWVPRSAVLEEALLASIRLPFLFEGFDAEAEKVTIRILTSLSRFENVGDLPQETVTALLLNDALREKVASEPGAGDQVALVREALVQQNKEKEIELRALRDKSRGLKGELDTARGTVLEMRASREVEVGERDQIIGQLNETLEGQRKALATSAARLDDEAAKREALRKQLDGVQLQLQERAAREAAALERRSFALRWVALPSAALWIAGSAVGSLFGQFTRLTSAELRAVVWAAGLAILIGVADQVGSRSVDIARWKPFHILHKLRLAAFALIAAIVVEMLTGKITGWLERP